MARAPRSWTGPRAGDCGDHWAANGQPRDWRRQFRGWRPRIRGRPPARGSGPRPHPAAPGAPVVARAGGAGAVQTRRPGRRRPGRQQAARAGVPHRGRARAGLRQPGDRGRAPVELDHAGRPDLPALRDRATRRVLRQRQRAPRRRQPAAAPLARGGRAVHRGGGTVVGGRGHRGGHRGVARRRPAPVPGAPGWRDTAGRAGLRPGQPGTGRPAGRAGRAADRAVAGHRVLRDPGRAGGRGGRDRRQLPGRGGDGAARPGKPRAGSGNWPPRRPRWPGPARISPRRMCAPGGSGRGTAPLPPQGRPRPGSSRRPRACSWTRCSGPRRWPP